MYRQQSWQPHLSERADNYLIGNTRPSGLSEWLHGAIGVQRMPLSDEPYPERERKFELAKHQSSNPEHIHVWILDTKYPPEGGILAECMCGEVRLTLPSDVFDNSLDEPGDLFPPDWK
jgi:hypothetical protein